MLINVSNHPSSVWPEKQLQEAQRMFGGVLDLPFPNIPPEADENDLRILVHEYVQKIMDYSKKYSDLCVHAMGEFTFTFALVRALENRDIPCYSSTTRRMVEEIMQDNVVKKISRFEFVRFRRYFNYDI